MSKKVAAKPPKKMNLLQEREKYIDLFMLYGKKLTRHQYNVFKNYYFEDYTIVELSEILGITKQAISDLLLRIRKILQDYEDKIGFLQYKINIKNHLSRNLSKIEYEKIMQIIGE